MIRIENTEVSGWEAAVRGLRNPMNSWEKSDSKWGCVSGHDETTCTGDCAPECTGFGYKLGDADLTLMKKLAESGSDHRKFMRMIVVTCDVTAPLYWWSEYDTYKVGTVANSCSKMHKIHAKELTLDDFSHEHLFTDSCDPDDPYAPENVLRHIIYVLNFHRRMFLRTKDKDHWWQMIQLLPSSYNQRRTVLLNYEVLRNIYHARKNHKLDCWVDFCKWIETLPYAELIKGGSQQ